MKKMIQRFDKPAIAVLPDLATSEKPSERND